MWQNDHFTVNLGADAEICVGVVVITGHCKMLWRGLSTNCSVTGEWWCGQSRVSPLIGLWSVELVPAVVRIVRSSPGAWRPQLPTHHPACSSPDQTVVRPGQDILVIISKPREIYNSAHLNAIPINTALPAHYTVQCTGHSMTDDINWADLETLDLRPDILACFDLSITSEGTDTQ